MKLPRFIVVAALAGFTLPVLPAIADEQTELIKQLLRRIDLLEKKVNDLAPVPITSTGGTPPVTGERFEQVEQKLRVLDRQNELAAEAAAEKTKTAPVVSLGSQGFEVRSGDTNFVFKIKALAQADSRWFVNNAGNGTALANESFLLRRARLMAEGTFFRDFDYQLVAEFGGGSSTGLPQPAILDANLAYRFSPGLQLKAGKCKSPVGLELLQSDPVTCFIERALPNNLIPNRDLGVQLSGDLLDGRLSYAAGIFNGSADNTSANNTDLEGRKEFAGRLFARPFANGEKEWLRGIGFGVGGSVGHEETVNNLPNSGKGTFLTDAQQPWFTYQSGLAGDTTGVVADGQHWRFSPQGYYYAGPFGLLGEYVISDQRVRAGNGKAAVPYQFKSLENTAWQLALSYVLTGETPSYKGITPRHNLSLADGTWGAFELVTRYADLEIDRAAFPVYASASASPRDARAYTLGFNWYPNRIFRASVNYTLTDFDGGSGTGNRHSENAVLTRLQVSF